MGVILALQIDQLEKLTLALYIGTNGELVIGNKDLLITGFISFNLKFIISPWISK